MNVHHPFRLLIITIVAVAIAWAPATVFGADGDDHDETAATQQQEVTLEEMSADGDSSAAEGTEQQSTFQQNGADSGNPGLVQTIGLNALWGGIAGGVVGLGIYLLTGMDTSPWIIAQFAGGGILVGGTIGLISGLARAEPDPDTRAEELPDSVDFVEQHAPATLDIPLVNTRF